jgi:hypothetical protein
MANPKGRTLPAVTILLCAFLSAGVPSAQAGGALETFDITAGTPSPIAGHILAKAVGIRWDARTIPVAYRMNAVVDPLPNALGAPFLTVADATTALQASLDSWNTIPTSYIDMRIVGTRSNPGLRGFDMVNEVTFNTAAGFTAIASSPSVSFITDVDLVDGDDIDGDGDSDVSGAIASAADVDADGDIEFPAGSYKAGTILDNDVQFNAKASNGFRFTVLDAEADTNTRSVDLRCVAVHEFGHSFGLSHVLNNQKSATDGTAATMFPFIDTGDPASELAGRTLDDDDIAFASYFYPEGTASSGPARVQPGDIPFKFRYGIVEGSVTHGVLGQPLAGASVYAVDLIGRSVTASAFSGTTQLSYNPVTGGLFFLPLVTDAIVDGKFKMPLPLGLYSLGVQAVDGAPVPVTSISFTTQIGNFFGQHNFNDEYYNFLEADVERYPGFGKPILVLPGLTRSGVNFVTNRTININNFGTRDFVGFTAAPAGRYYAVRVPASQFVAANPDGKVVVHGALFDTTVADASVAPRFAEALLTKGTLNADGSVATLDFVKPLARATGFLGRDNDFAPFFFVNPSLLGKKIRQGIDQGTITDLFLVLRLPTTTPFPGVSALPPFIGLDGGVATNDVPILGYSYVSDDAGATFTRNTQFNFRFSLVLSEPPAH